MQPFTLTEARDNKGAINILASNKNAKVIAGGTNLLDLMKMYVERPEQLIDINGLDFKRIEVLPGGGIRIGALVTNTDLAYHPAIIKQYPVLSEAVLAGASAQLRNMATTGGNKDREELEEVKRKTENEKKNFEGYGSADEIKKNYLSNVRSKAAAKVNGQLKKLGLPTMPEHKDEFMELCNKLGV